MSYTAEFVNIVVWALVGVCIWIFNDKTKKYDAHLKECNDRNERVAGYEAKMAERISAIEHNSRRSRAEIQWLGDCMIQLGTRLKADLPDRPE